MTLESLSAAILSVMLSAAPPGRSLIPDAIETPEDGAARYETIAEAIADVSNGNTRTAALLMSVSFFESGWRRDVHSGVGPLARGDAGRSCTIYQLNYGRGWLCEELLADDRAAAREALALIRRSFRACKHLPRELRLSVYGSGSCSRGHAGSRARMQVADRFHAKLVAQ